MADRELRSSVRDHAASDLIDRHFGTEKAHDNEATLRAYCGDILWDDGTRPRSSFRGKRANTEADGGVLQAANEFVGMAAWGAPVSFRVFRVLYVFDRRDSLMARETAWFDSAGMHRQMETFHHG